MHLRHGTSLLSTLLPFWTIGKENMMTKNFGLKMVLIFFFILENVLLEQAVWISKADFTITNIGTYDK